MTDTATIVAKPVERSGSAVGPRLPGVGALLISQIGYQMRLLLASGRTLVVGIGFPIILLVASNGKGAHPDVAGYAVFGLTAIAWSGYGARLVAAREAGVLKRWRASPLPRWCYFLGCILATGLVALMAAAVTFVAAFLFYGAHFGDGAGVQLTLAGAFALVFVFALGALAWAAAATAMTSMIPTVEAAFPILMLIYFPMIIISGVLFSISEPHWLSTLATYLPAQPLIDAASRAVHHSAGASFLPAHDVIVLAAWAVGGLLAAVLVFRWEPHRPNQRRAARKLPQSPRTLPTIPDTPNGVPASAVGPQASQQSVASLLEAKGKGL